MKNYYFLKFSNSVLKQITQDYKFIDESKFQITDKGGWYDHAVETNKYVDLKFLDSMRNDGIEISPRATIFVGGQNCSLKIHIDARKKDHSIYPSVWGINFVWQSKKSRMIWYKTKENIVKSISVSGIANPYWKFDSNEVDLIDQLNFDETTILRPILVRTDIPHTVFNDDAHNIRYCLCLRDSVEKRQNSWEETLNLFSKFLID